MNDPSLSTRGGGGEPPSTFVRHPCRLLGKITAPKRRLYLDEYRRPWRPRIVGHPANRRARHPCWRLHRWALCGSIHGAATTIDWLEETTPSASACLAVQLIPSSSRRHRRQKGPASGANRRPTTLGSSTAAGCVTLSVARNGPVRVCPRSFLACSRKERAVGRAILVPPQRQSRSLLQAGSVCSSHRIAD